MEVHGGENIYDVARRALNQSASRADAVSFTFNRVTSIVFNGQTVESVVDGHWAEVERQQKLLRDTPAYVEAQRVLGPLSEEVKDAMRDLLVGDGR